MDTIGINHRHAVESGLQELELFVRTRLKGSLKERNHSLPVMESSEWRSALVSILPVDDITWQEELILTLALVPHVRPYLMDRLIQEYFPGGGDLPQLGGIRGKNHRGFIPTGETALFLLGGSNLTKRFESQKLFVSEHWFAKKQVLQLSSPANDEPFLSGSLLLNDEYVEKLTVGKASRPRFSNSFPASLITTGLDWNDLVLPRQTEQQIGEILIWLSHHQTLMKDLGMERVLKPGYLALFHGPPGTGKTLTANLLGKHTSREVYRVDLSTVVSKYIGETEKNLSSLFDRAENKDWILFFDEADALFGKRTQVHTVNDRYANQEVAYLLQRVEDYKGLVILASNFKSNIDEAFMRRFHSIIHFPIPRSNERLRLWQNAFPQQIKLTNEVSLRHLSHQFELTGASIMSVVQYVCLKALSRDSLKIRQQDILEGIKREQLKSGKIV